MANCLVTRLNGIVENDNLDVFGNIEFTANVPAGGGELVIGMSNPGKVTIENGNIGHTGNTSVLSTGYNTVGFDVVDTSKPIIIKINSKYNLISFENTGLDIIKAKLEDFRYAPLSGHLKLSGISNETNDDVVGDINVFNNKDLKQITLSQYRTNVTGDISVFGSMPNLTIINLTTSMKLIGSIESIIEGMCLNGRNNDSLYINAKYINGITFHDVNTIPLINNLKVLFSDTGAEISIAEGSKIATYTKATNTWEYEEV